MLSVYSEVSPLTSPRASTDLDPTGSPDVSPIELRPLASHEFPKLDPKARSQLPILRKVDPAAESASPGSVDGIEGKETTSPVERSKEERLAMLKEKNRKLLSGFQERPSSKSTHATRPQRSDSLDHPVYREPWKGASGRTTLVEPVRNVPRARHDSGPVPKRKSESKDSSAHNIVTMPTTQGISTEPTSHTAPSQHRESIETADEPIKPTAPLKVGNNTTRVRSPVTAENLSGPFNPRYSDATISSYDQATSDIDGSRDEAKVTSPTSAKQESTKASSNTCVHPRPPSGDRDPSSRFSWTTKGTTTPPPKTPENDPASRFSWTTYASSVHESPHTMALRDASAPPVPPMPYMPNAMAMRKRPITSSSPDPNSISKPKINRKPTPSDMTRNRSSSFYSTTTTVTEAQKSPTSPPVDRSKSLPQCPPELEAKDRIAGLEARMDVLTRRRNNIHLILKELNNVVQPTSFAYDLATRAEVQKTVKGLEDELSEIRVEEYDMGMKLHRALKKRDQENVYGYPTGLWIKRVTS